MKATAHCGLGQQLGRVAGNWFDQHQCGRRASRRRHELDQGMGREARIRCVAIRRQSLVLGTESQPAISQNAGQILVPTRVSSDTNWVDVGSERQQFRHQVGRDALGLGRGADVYTGVSDPSFNVAPMRGAQIVIGDPSPPAAGGGVKD